VNTSAHPAFELVVIGGGPAGASGANAAGLLGRRVALVEQTALVGGAGINTGTIPSKTLRETSPRKTIVMKANYHSQWRGPAHRHSTSRTIRI
jgi:pyruvate/2-oxoglutarate dehydrogenase complex dihydrolipoamide dehydrogenase (E3) component